MSLTPLRSIAHETPVDFRISTELRCPECGRPPIGTVEVFGWSIALGEATVVDDTIVVAYSGETKTDPIWNSQRTIRLDDRPLLACALGHAFLVLPSGVAANDPYDGPFVCPNDPTHDRFRRAHRESVVHIFRADGTFVDEEKNSLDAEGHFGPVTCRECESVVVPDMRAEAA
jgi:hypothetical protein